MPPKLSLSPDASPAALRAVRSRPVSLVRQAACMLYTRRTVISWLLAGPLMACQSTDRSNQEQRLMYGLIGKIRTVPGQRDALASLLIQGTSAMPGCLSYIVAADMVDPDALWVTEVWESSTSHRASLSLPAVQHAIAKGKPLIAGFGERFETEPIGGFGLRPK